MTKKILLLNGNPKSQSYCQHLTHIYQTEASQHFDVKRFDIFNMDFNPSLDCGYDSKQALESCLVDFQQGIKWAEHIVIVTPVWWGGLPAKLKGLFDRAFLPGFSFEYENGNPLPIPLLNGKTARIIMTMDAPIDYLEQQAGPIVAQLDMYTLQFCGIEKAKLTLFGSIISGCSDHRLDWEQTVQAVASKGA